MILVGQAEQALENRMRRHSERSEKSLFLWIACASAEGEIHDSLGMTPLGTFSTTWEACPTLEPIPRCSLTPCNRIC